MGAAAETDGEMVMKLIVIQAIFNVAVVAALLMQWRMNQALIKFIKAQNELNHAVLGVHEAILDAGKH